MTLKTCYRCDWQGETTKPNCPHCGVPLYGVGPSPSGGTGSPARTDPEDQSREAANIASIASADTRSLQSNPSPSPMDAVESSSRSTRSAVAFALAALVLTVTLGNWLNRQKERKAPAASTSPSPMPAGVFDIHPLIGRHELTVEGVLFSFRVRDRGWARFGGISINKSIVGPQGAEAIIFWTSFPDGGIADPCANLLRLPVGQSAADLAAAVSTAPGTELVTGPSQVTVGGHAAEHVVLTVRKNVGCDPGFFYTWKDVDAGPLWPVTGVGDTIRVWIFDIEGTLLFIEAETHKQADSDLKHEVQQIVESIRFD